MSLSADLVSVNPPPQHPHPVSEGEEKETEGKRIARRKIEERAEWEAIKTVRVALQCQILAVHSEWSDTRGR